MNAATNRANTEKAQKILGPNVIASECVDMLDKLGRMSHWEIRIVCGAQHFQEALIGAVAIVRSSPETWRIKGISIDAAPGEK